MKTPIKIVLLLTGIGACVAGVLLFVATVLSPPKAHVDKEVYDKDLEASYGEYASGDYIHTDEDFDRHANLLDRMLIEKVIDDDIYAKRRLEVVSDYVPRLAASAINYLNRTIWVSDKIDDIETRVSEISKEYDGYISDGLISEPSDTVRGRFDTALSTIKSYRQALKLADLGFFGSLESAKERLRQAEGYLSHPLLGHVTYLRDKLQNLPRRIEYSHYAHLTDLIKRIPAVGYGDSHTRDEAIYKARSKVAEYRQNARGMYGQYARDVSHLDSEIDNIAARFI